MVPTSKMLQLTLSIDILFEHFHQSGVISQPYILEHMHKRKKGMSCQILASLDSVYARKFLSLLTTGLCNTQLLKNVIFIAGGYSYEMNPFYHSSTKFTCQ